MRYIRLKLARLFYRWAKRLAPEVKRDVDHSGLMTDLVIPQDAVVEADETAEQWQPEQHGNVVIAEPPLMRQYRRGKL